VREAVHALDYHPNRVARNLRRRATRTIGVIISDIQNPFFTSVVRGIEDVLQAADYTLLLGNSDENRKREQLYLATLRSEGTAGIIFAPSTVDADEYRQVTNAGVPLVAIDRELPSLPIDIVVVDNRGGARAAVTHLVDLGHRRIGFVGGPRQISTAIERLRGYEEALAVGGIDLIPNLVCYADFRQSGGHDAMHSLLQQPELPTAVFVANNLMTLGAIQAIQEQGLRIPDDIAVVGFDDMDWAPSLQPPLTAVAQPTYEMGATAARLLLERLAEPERPPRHIVLATRLMVRASSGAAVENHSAEVPM
jgi:DNA-binding LacI/PurR family transcriptional regulator